tara:strand:+ start:165109 stop:166158 length:1050 start_codon:yes stop_codon:yes gene_type:complete
MTTQPKKAVALISGGLDSMLAAKLMQEQGIHVEGVNFYTGFCVEGHTQAIRKQDQNKEKRNNALWVAEQLGIKLHIVDIVEDYKDVVINPKYGYGQHMNPCLDCKVFMVKEAKKWMKENDFDFIITGEVIGQRPMSQRKATMPIISKRSGADDRLLRPLCAQNLEPTLPEREGWVDREKLLGITGRSRKPQIALAEGFGIDEYSQPAGGCCMLTNDAYSKKLVDLWQHRGKRDYELDDVVLLKIGRHIRPKPHFKLIIAREEGEGKYLHGYRNEFTRIFPVDHVGALAIIDGELKDEADEQLAGQIVARYCQGRDEASVKIQIEGTEGIGKVIDVKPLHKDDVLKEWFV